MRTVTFQSVFDAILRRHGLDPLGDAVNHDTARAIVEHINNRVDTAWKMWDWPQLSRTEERAFRSVWNSTREFHVEGEDGQPDEFYYLGDETYYRVSSDAVADPPAGTLPTATDYFEALEGVTPYIQFDQTCRRSIGYVHGIYPADPSNNGCRNQFGLHFRPSEQGVHVFLGAPRQSGAATGTVWVWYALPVSQFTVVPYIAGKTYDVAARVFYPATGECYRATAESTNHAPTDGDYWVIEPMPEIFATYVKAGAFADSLKEIGASGDAAALQKAAAAIDEAERAIQGEIDLLLAQGQKHFYGAVSNRVYDGGTRISEPWGGDKAFPLTDVCEADSMFASPPATPTPGIIYGDDIVALLATTAAPALNQVTTVGRAINTIIKIVIDPNYPGTDYENQEYRLRPGPADQDDPGQVAPLDYSLATNNKHWERVD